MPVSRQRSGQKIHAAIPTDTTSHTGQGMDRISAFPIGARRSTSDPCGVSGRPTRANLAVKNTQGVISAPMMTGCAQKVGEQSSRHRLKATIARKGTAQIYPALYLVRHAVAASSAK